MSEIETKGSLCSGTGALDRATPGALQWVAETNDAASLVLKREHPDVPNLGDITTDPARFTHVDLLTSGDPCQSMSAAGRQRASGDERFLWPDVMKIIEHAKPKQIFLENVQNLVSVPLIKGGERGGVLALRLENLRAAGYAVRWTVLGACAVGAPHHRHRWFLRAWHVGTGADDPEYLAHERVINKCGAPRNAGRVLLPSPVARDSDGRGEDSPEYWAERFTRRNNGIPLGAAVALLPSPTTADGSGGPGTSPKRTGGMNLRTAATLIPERWGKFADAIALWEGITGISAPDPTESAPRGGRRLSAALSEWMMGYPTGYLTTDASRNEALHMAGNGVVARQARAAWDLLEWPA